MNGSTVSGDLVLGLGVTNRSRAALDQRRPDTGEPPRRRRRVDVETISGDVRLDLVGGVDAEFDVSSFSGDIRNCFGPKPACAQTNTLRARNCASREGKGSARVRIKTLSGDVSLCRK